MTFTVTENKVRAKMISASAQGFNATVIRIEEFANEEAYEEAKAFANNCGQVTDYGVGFLVEWRRA